MSREKLECDIQNQIRLLMCTMISAVRYQSLLFIGTKFPLFPKPYSEMHDDLTSKEASYQLARMFVVLNQQYWPELGNGPVRRGRHGNEAAKYGYS